MISVRILGETDHTVTISRDDWLRLQEQLEDAQDRAAVAERRDHERRIGKEAARHDYLTADEALRLLNGESPVKVWREKRGMSQRVLAAEADIAPSYLGEIETGRKRGSSDAYRKLGAVLHVPADELDARHYRVRDPEFGPVRLCLVPGSAGVAPGRRMKRVGHTDFGTLGGALDFVRDEWSSLRARSPWITDAKNLPIYDTDELIRVIEG
jgi:transcriptional regulator with XRE-family HTH domain